MKNILAEKFNYPIMSKSTNDFIVSLNIKTKDFKTFFYAVEYSINNEISHDGTHEFEKLEDAEKFYFDFNINYFCGNIKNDCSISSSNKKK